MRPSVRLVNLFVPALLMAACDSNGGAPDRGSGGREAGGGDTTGREMQTCAEVSRKAELPPLDMLLALDTSYSMDFNQKWPAVKAALKVFATDPSFASVGVGLQYFPLRAQCSAEDYAVPAVPIGPLATAAGDIITSLDKQRMSGGTPMVPMLTGAITYAREWASQHTGRKTVVVMATDGIPDSSCLAPLGTTLPNTLTNVVTVVTDGVTSSPSIPTFVIGVGTEPTALDQIAKAGGTNKAFLVDVNKDIQKDFLAALNDIRRELACEFQIPPPPSGETVIDYSAVNVRYTNGSTVETFVYVKDKASCSSAPDKGWYYDSPSKPTKIVLCEETCKKVQYHDNSRIDVLFGCRTIPA